ncbi:hypothetical protein SLEP1_g56905 [Rubroshorea leprosula]|uniref:Integrase catalytic domain-containing protein n=1 Tax=Rubroshorea leprosula TaxID=152421 RepID=A0AAV5MMV2_9ROSI|nr:hypothetical protein SLEP1_g56905 [Rubroshorea leprosula]
MTSFERIVTHPATATVAKEVIEQPNVNLKSLKQVILNLFNAPTALYTALGTKPWYFDSGCCNHMSSITAHFSSMSPNNSFPDIYSADGFPMNDPRRRQLLGTSRKVGHLFELNYLHIPDNKMDTPSFPNDRFIQALLCAIELESLQIPYQQIFQVCAATNISPLHLWHSRLGHTSVELLSLQWLLEDMGIPQPSSTDLYCDNQSAMQIAHNDVFHERTKHIEVDCHFIRHHVNLQSNQLYLFQVVILILLLLLILCIMMFGVHLLHPPWGVPVLRTDNATEYLGTKLQSFLKEQGTLPQQSCPYTSEQNGRAERKHRHILDSVRALLISSSCPERFWGEAALTTAYLINRIPSSVLNNQSPYERLHGILLAYNLLKVFGCACFVLLPPHEHNKLEPRARLCCFLGYGITQKGYRCLDPVSQKLQVSRHVVFWEHTMFSSLSNFKVSPSHQPPFFTNLSIELFPSDSNAGTSDELYNASPHAPTSSVEDDLPASNALDNFEPSSTSSSTNELVVPSSSHPTQIAHNDVFHERTKHIEVDCRFIHHHVAQGTVHLVFIDSADQPADLFTKAHFPGRFRTLLSKLKLVSSQLP